MMKRFFLWLGYVRVSDAERRVFAGYERGFRDGQNHETRGRVEHIMDIERIMRQVKRKFRRDREGV